jgi:hypothetical protein
MHAPRPLAVSPVYCGRFRAIRLRWCLLPAALAAATVFVCVFSSLPRPVAHFLCIRQALHVVIDRLAKVHQRLVRNPEKVVHTHSVLWRCCSHGDCHRPSLRTGGATSPSQSFDTARSLNLGNIRLWSAAIPVWVRAAAAAYLSGLADKPIYLSGLADKLGGSPADLHLHLTGF